MRLRSDTAVLVVLASLSLSGCSTVSGKPEPACRPLETTELPRLHGIRGAWMDDELFVLADRHDSRLLVYSISGGRIRMVNGWESDDTELNFQTPMDIERWGDGFVLADISSRRPPHLLGLDPNLRPASVLWEADAERVEGRWVGEGVTSINRVLALGDRLYLEAGRWEGSREFEYAEFGFGRGSGHRPGTLGEQASWPIPAGERMYRGQRLAATVGTGASAFVLRYPETPFIQRLAGEDELLAAFPEVPAPLPELPRGLIPAEAAAYYGVLEAASYPAGLFGDEDSLYVLVRDATGEETVWDLHRIDPERDEVVGVLRLPTTATHVSLLPGSKYWLLEESSSFQDSLPAPTRLLLLSSAAIRAGEVPLCY